MAAKASLLTHHHLTSQLGLLILNQMKKKVKNNKKTKMAKYHKSSPSKDISSQKINWIFLLNENEIKNYLKEDIFEAKSQKSIEEENSPEKDTSSIAASNTSADKIRKLSDSVINKFGSLWGRTTTQI
ncbi:hypothetical protein Mgra_00008461 [Meloidogyne graminicola]|uniref:Uncharacterized protein n=1 Tax=Meloidogyne graminicola TaxID=189291 RepID=A0A8S9ZFT1_9BILA|nr:hypothetical protein Mgra_00008461 [Meloidogyne graminicola]